MDCRLLTGDHFDLSDYRLGTPQHSGSLTVVPITTQQSTPLFLSPFGAEKVEPRHTTGPALLHHDLEKNCLLAPLHFSAPRRRGVSTIMSRVALQPPSRREDFAGDIFVSPFARGRCRGCPAIYSLPLALRDVFWRHRPISEGNDLQSDLRRHGFGLFPGALHHPEVKRWTCRIELLAGQTGALFFIADRPVGMEIAPSPAYFKTIWQPLLTGCYGLTALLSQYNSPQPATSPEPLAVSSLAELRTEMFRTRHRRQEHLEAALAARPEGAFTIETDLRWQNYHVQSLTGTAFAGQYIEEVSEAVPEVGGGSGIPQRLRTLFRKAPTRRRVVYASLFALEPNPRP